MYFIYLFMAFFLAMYLYDTYLPYLVDIDEYVFIFCFCLLFSLVYFCIIGEKN